MNKICANCGNTNSAEMTFCINCGQSLTASGGAGGSYPNADNSAMYAGGMPPALPNLPVGATRKSSRAWMWILGVVGVLGVILAAGIVGLFALLSSINKPNGGDYKNDNRLIVSTSPTPNSNRGGNSNSKSNGNSNGNTNYNRNSNINANTNANDNSDGDSGDASLTGNMVLSDVAQPQVGEFKLDRKENAPEWKSDTSALEAENHYYSNSKETSKPTVTIVRYATVEQAQKNLRDSMTMYKNRKDTTTEILECVDKSDQTPIGITATAREKKSNTYRRYWTDGKFMFVASIVGDKTPAEKWMSGSKY